MVLELVASRLIARTLGSSLYTWTAVIGVILAGITIGNYLGGRIADKFPAKKAVAIIFAICSVACVITVILNNIVGGWTWLWSFNWPLRVFTHVSLVFLIPSALLGTISPVVAKMALDRGLPAGRTIGDIYAWSAAGSIAGTFVAGYYLIALMGTITIIWVVGAVLLLMSILYWFRFWPLYILAVVFFALMTMAMIPAEWAKNTSSSIALREQRDPRIIYEDESRYCYITIWQEYDNPNKRTFNQDTLTHSQILMNNILDLQYFYANIYAVVTAELGKYKKTLNVMVIGGGGYVFPRYIEKIWPGSRIDVAEIDPAVTKAAMQAFGLDKHTTINTINLDARNYVDELLERKHNGEKIPQYDFVYGDAFNHYSVPFQLVTKEFNDKISAILSDDGVYMINMIDIFDSGLFLGSVINTLKETFPYVYAATQDKSHSVRNTFVIVAAKHKLDIKNMLLQYKNDELKIWYLDDADMNSLKEKSGHLILTDNYCPVENLLAPVVRDSVKRISISKYIWLAENFKQKGQFTKSIENYLAALEMNPAVSVQSYNEIGIMYARMGKPQQAVDAFNKAIRYNEQSEDKINMAITYRNLGVALKDMGKAEDAAEQFHKAVEESQKVLNKNPADHANWQQLGDTLTKMGNFKAATEAYKKALSLSPNDPAYYANLAKALESQERYSEEIEVLKNYIQLTKQSKLDDAVSELQKHLEFLEQKVSSGQKN
jgi:tetratricopeptide (TPR) repeat protein/MFS family permease